MNLKSLNGKLLVVVKVGSSFLTSKHNQINKYKLQRIVSQICRLKKSNINVVLVSSGAVVSGMHLSGYSLRPKNIIDLQAIAAIGQSELMHNYSLLFRKEKIITAQILLTPEVLHNRQRYLNARNTILNLLKKNIIPIVNENDTVATDELKFGDNDQLSALVSVLIDAKLLIILSDVEGVYGLEGKIIKKIDEIDENISGLDKGSGKQTTVGGMTAKFAAAKIAVNAGIAVVIANGSKSDILLKLIESDQAGTWFMPKKNKISGKKRWIAFSCRSRGKIFIDHGAQLAIIQKGKSLLSSGISSIDGNFSQGDLVVICGEQGNQIAKGLVNYSALELEKIKGVKTSKIEHILGYKFYDEVIHRDNLVVLE